MILSISINNGGERVKHNGGVSGLSPHCIHFTDLFRSSENIFENFCFIYPFLLSQFAYLISSDLRKKNDLITFLKTSTPF